MNSMEDILDEETPIGKVYKERAFWVGTFLGGPLVAGYLFSENFKALDRYEMVKTTWIITIIVTIVVFGGVFLIPESVNLPNQAIPLAYTFAAGGLFKKHQEAGVLTHLNSGGLFHN